MSVGEDEEVLEQLENLSVKLRDYNRNPSVYLTAEERQKLQDAQSFLETMHNKWKKEAELRKRETVDTRIQELEQRIKELEKGK